MFCVIFFIVQVLHIANGASRVILRGAKIKIKPTKLIVMVIVIVFCGEKN